MAVIANAGMEERRAAAAVAARPTQTVAREVAHDGAVRQKSPVMIALKITPCATTPGQVRWMLVGIQSVRPVAIHPRRTERPWSFSARLRRWALSFSARRALCVRMRRRASNEATNVQ